jgi:adenylate cyclase
VAERHIPAWQVLEPGFDNDRVAGYILVLGVAAAGLTDAKVAPISQSATGAVLNAQAMEQIYLEVFLTRPLWATGAELVFLFALGLVLSTAFVSARLGAVTSTVLGALLVAAGLGVSWWAFTRHGLLLDPVYPVFVGSLIYLSNALLKYIVSEAQRKEVRTAFGQYVAPALVDELARNPGALKLGGEQREMSILFCDVRNFTNISESLEPRALTHLLNRFLTVMSDEILKRRGTIDKYMGDAIMAFWNAPLPEPDHARQACATALAMVAALPRFNQELEADALYGGFDFGRFRCGIGINTGPCLVGNIGSNHRFDYSVLGNTVNVASRIEGQCKTYGVAIVIGESTHAAAPEFAALELDLIRVTGKRQATRIYALLGGPEVAGSTAFADLATAHDAMLAAYRQRDWATALTSIARCRALPVGRELSPLYDEYERRIAAFLTDPPGADWGGIYVARTK